jgi:hypothetical protein
MGFGAVINLLTHPSKAGGVFVTLANPRFYHLSMCSLNVPVCLGVAHQLLWHQISSFNYIWSGLNGLHDRSHFAQEAIWAASGPRPLRTSSTGFTVQSGEFSEVLDFESSQAQRLLLQCCQSLASVHRRAAAGTNSPPPSCAKPQRASADHEMRKQSAMNKTQHDHRALNWLAANVRLMMKRHEHHRGRVDDIKNVGRYMASVQYPHTQVISRMASDTVPRSDPILTQAAPIHRL